MSTTQPTWKKVTLWVISIFVGLSFLAAGGMKLVGPQVPTVVASFARYGYPDWFRVVTGSIEVASGLMVLIPRTRFYGAALLICTMVGAILTHIRAGEYPLMGMPILLLILNVILAWTHRPAMGRHGASPGAV